MAINEFLAFGTSAAANVDTQANFAANPSTLNGFAAGVAQSKELNKVWRQGSFGTAAMAQFVMETLDVDARDNGDLALFTTNFTEAVRRIGTGGLGGYLPLTGGTIHRPAYATPLTIRADTGYAARIRYTVDDVASWTTGPGTAGGFAIIDEAPTAGTRINIDPSGLVHVYQNLRVDGGATLGIPAMLSRNPLLPLEAATKFYVDDRINEILAGSGYVPEAPNDGITYGRRSLTWTPAVSAADLAGYLPLTGGTLYQPGAADPLTIQTNGLAARIHYYNGSRLWAAGITNTGNFTINDLDAPAQRLFIDAAGLVTIPQSLQVSGGALMVTGYTWLNGGASVGVNLWVAGSATVVGDISAAGAITSQAGAYIAGYYPSTGYGLIAQNVAEFRSGLALTGARNWALGIDPTGQFMISDVSAMLTRLSIDTTGRTHTGDIWAHDIWANLCSFNQVMVANSDWTTAVTVYADISNEAGIQYDNGLGTIFSAGVNPAGHFFIYNAITATTRLAIESGQITIVGNLVISGTAWKPGGGPWSDSSDRRLKKDVEDYQRGLDAVRQLRPVAYRFNGLGESLDDGKTYHGLIAQEAIDVMPEMVSEEPRKLRPDDDAETSIYMMDCTALTFALVNSVRELADRLETLERRG